MSLAESGAASTADALLEAGIETRRWWGDGAHAHRATAGFPRDRLPATEALARSTIALPFFRGLELSQIQRVVEALGMATAD